MTLEELFQPGTAPIVGSLITTLVAINTVFFRWLVSSFKELRSDIRLQNVEARRVDEANQVMFQVHEDKDQERHEENLYRFEKIAVALAKLGSSNGTYEKKENRS